MYNRGFVLFWIVSCYGCFKVFWFFAEKFGSTKVDDELIARFEKVTGKPGMLIVQMIVINMFTIIFFTGITHILSFWNYWPCTFFMS